MIDHRTRALTAYRMALWTLRVGSLLAGIIVYYFAINQWIYVGAASTDGRQYQIETIESE